MTFKTYEAIGLFIQLNEATDETINNLSNIDAKVKTDVLISYKGDYKRYSFKEFVQRLGYEVKE